jgi:hypothetical protein
MSKSKKSLTLGEARKMSLRILREAEERRIKFAEEEAKRYILM